MKRSADRFRRRGGWLVLWSGLLLPVSAAWAARPMAMRGQWTVGDLIGALIIVGILGGLVAFFFWPRRSS